MTGQATVKGGGCLRKKQLFVLLLVTAIFSSSGTYLAVKWLDGNKAVSSPVSGKGEDHGFSKVKKAYELILDGYIEEVDGKDLIEGAIEGMLAALNDPYSVYLHGEKAARFNEALDSSFEGIGAEISESDGKIIIVTPFKNSPAEKAGLKPFDQILSVDGEDVTGMDLYDVTLKIRGEKGTTVTLEILREGSVQPVSVNVKRDRIPVETVFSEVIKHAGKQIGYIEITSFSRKTGDDFTGHLRQLEKENIDGLIIDVRGNPGGLLQSVQQIAGMLVPNEKPLFQVEKKDGHIEQFYSGQDKKKPYPIAVLTDKGSASASEILAAALKEIGGYPVIGERTFGKGTVQQQIDLDNDSRMKLTMFKWLTPDGNRIHGKGIEPDLAVSQSGLYHLHPLQVDEPLSRDLNNEQVRHAQLVLKNLGYEPGRLDGYFNKTTEAAVRNFQEEHDLPVTGVIDQKTAVEMDRRVMKEREKKENDRQLQMALKYFQYR